MSINSIKLYDSNKEYEMLNKTFSISPSYIDLVVDLWHTTTWYYSPNMWHGYTFPKSFINDFNRQFHFQQKDVYLIGLIAIVITIVRYEFERQIYKYLLPQLNIHTSNIRKFPESAWKFLLYTCTWLYCFYLVRYRYDYFDNPFMIWDDWSHDMVIPLDITVLYLFECGFYVHSIYATIFMDLKRKDFHIMLLHHVLTITLIFVSYCTRYHKIGLLVFFMHDITDICLELSKVMRYLSVEQGGVSNSLWKSGSQIGFFIFAYNWFLFRLYWYPLKVLYSSGIVFVHRALSNGCGLYTLFNCLLWILLSLNLYWLFFIVQVIVKYLTDSLPETGDARDHDDEQPSSTSGYRLLDNKEKKY